MARTVAAVERLNISAGDSLSLMVPLDQSRLDAALAQLAAETALIVLGDRRALDLVAFVEEGDAEGERDIAEDLRVLRPGDHGARRHHRRNIAVDEARPRQIGERDHRADRLAPVLAVVARRLGED